MIYEETEVFEKDCSRQLLQEANQHFERIKISEHLTKNQDALTL
jgi:hypothetical protein